MSDGNNLICLHMTIFPIDDCADGLGLFGRALWLDRRCVRDLEALLSPPGRLLRHIRLADPLAPPFQVQPGSVCADSHHTVYRSPVILTWSPFRFVRARRVCSCCADMAFGSWCGTGLLVGFVVSWLPLTPPALVYACGPCFTPRSVDLLSVCLR